MDSSQYDPQNLIDEVAVVIVAAGSGERLGSGRPKAFVWVAGEVMLAHSLRTFEAHPAVDFIVLVVPEDWNGPAEVLVDDLGCDKVASIETGGATRAESVRAGLRAVSDRGQTAVLVHDAARPLVADAVIDRVLAPLADGVDAVVPALQATDTIKIKVDGVVGTPARSSVFRAQTPQACRASVLHRAYNSNINIASVTDCSQAIEMVGGRVQLVDGDERLLKITVTHDLAQIESLLGYQPRVKHIVGDDVDDEDDTVIDPFAVTIESENQE